MTRWRDPLCILLVGAVCSASYAFGLRLYSDDWFFVEPLMTSDDQSWSGLYRALAERPYVGVRPVQILWYVAFHKLAPGGVALVHLANHTVFAAATIVLYAAMRATPRTRRAAYYVAMLYACLPTFSVAKMWYANHQAVLALMLFAVTWWLLARAALAAGRERRAFAALAGAAAALGNLSYELFAATALALPLFVWWALGAGDRALAGDRAFLGATAAIFAGLAATTLLKLSYGYGTELPPGIDGPLDFARSAASMYLGAARTTFWTLGLYSPRAAAGIAAGPFMEAGALAAPIAGLAILAARERLARRDRGDGREAGPGFFALSGAAAFMLGYIPYLGNFLYSPKPWGEGNRGNIAAALGAALLIYAAFRWARGHRPAIARAALVLFCAVGVFLQVAVGRTWVRAAEDQDRMFARFAAVARGSLADRGTVLVYGTCPYYGAGPVFPYGWDLRARLAVERGYREIEVALVWPQLAVKTGGLAMPRDRWGAPFHPYGALHILDMAGGTVTRIGGPEDARRFFAAHPRGRSITCAFDFGIGNPLY